MDADFLIGLSVGVLGILTTVLLWMLDRVRQRRAIKPRAAFGALTLYGPERPVRPDLAFAVGFQFTNLGGAMISPVVSIEDPRGLFTTEPVSRSALGSGQAMTDAAGLQGPRTAVDLRREAADFVRRATWYVLCWDARGRRYLFTPTGELDVTDRDDLPMTPDELLKHLLVHGNKLSPPRGSGAPE